MAIQEKKPIYYGDTPKKAMNNEVQGEYVTLLDENYYCIHNYDALDPFFITVVSSSNHWLFISTTGGLSAGRIDANHALFPYYTVDKITENHENTGAKTLLLITSDTGQLLWEPFSNRNSGVYQLERNLYKNVSGTSIVFPLARPAIATVVVIHAIGIWNEVVLATIYLSNDSAYPVTRGLLVFQGVYGSDWPVLAAAVMLMTIPMVVLFLFLQRYIVSGLTQVAVKS